LSFQTQLIVWDENFVFNKQDSNSVC